MVNDVDGDDDDDFRGADRALHSCHPLFCGDITHTNHTHPRNKQNQKPKNKKGYEWASTDWAAATWRKVGAVEAVARMGFSALNSDLDVAWLRDPLPFFDRCVLLLFCLWRVCAWVRGACACVF